MKTLYSTFALILIINIGLTQTGRLNNNNIDVTINPSNVMFQTLFPDTNSYFGTIKENGSSTIFASSLWMFGTDATNQLIGSYPMYMDTSLMKYNSTGPLEVTPGSGNGTTTKNFGSAYITNTVRAKWNKVFCINKVDIELFLRWYNSPSSYPGYNIPSSILDWPAHGDPSPGKNQDFYLAPFYDNPNGPSGADGVYNPLDGDYPCIKGDNYCWFIVNDQPDIANYIPIGVEIHTEVYTFNKDSLNPLSNTVFVGRDIINRSIGTYSDFIVSQFTDFDIGCGQDDYIGSMPSLNSYYGYNADATDDNCSGGRIPYGSNPPAQGVTFLNQSMNSSMFFTNSSGNSVNNSTEAYNLMKGLYGNGASLYYGPSSPQTPNNVTKFAFPYLPPAGKAPWTEVTSGNAAGDRRMLGSTAPITLSPGQVVELDIAYVFSRNDSGNISSVDKLYRDNQTVQAFYNDSIPNGCQAFVLSVPEETKIKANIYPNPTTNIFTIETNGPNTRAEVVSVDGRLIASGLQLNQTTKIDASAWENGLYLVKVYTEEGDFIVLRIVKN